MTIINCESEQNYVDALRSLWKKNWPPGILREPFYPFGEKPLTEYIRKWSQIQPDKAAYIFYGHKLTYRTLDLLSDRFAALLNSKGVVKGERVAVFLPNCPQFVIAFFGILKLGCVHVPVNPMFKEHELLYELNDTGAEVIIAQDCLLPLVRRVMAKTKLRLIYFTNIAEFIPEVPSIPLPKSIIGPKVVDQDAIDFIQAIKNISNIYQAPVVELDEIAVLNYTGGTTGMPKGCIHTQRDMIYTAATFGTVGMRSSHKDVILCFHQAFWIGGENSIIVFPIFSGATCVMMARYDPLGVMAAIQNHKVTHASMLVDNALEIMDHPDVHSYNLSSLFYVRVNSFIKKLTPAVRRRWKNICNVTLIEAAYGLTETHTMDTFTSGMQKNDFDLNSRPVFVGLPVPGTDLKICDFDTGKLKALNEEGEICVRSPSLFKGYWNNLIETEKALRAGWLHTGDIGLIDDGGYLHYLVRRKELIKVKGMSVFPTEIEQLLGQHPEVESSAVIGRPDQEKGEVPVAFICLKKETRNNVVEADLIKWCKKNMAIYKVPEIKFVDALPLTVHGKVKKQELMKTI